MMRKWTTKPGVEFNPQTSSRTEFGAMATIAQATAPTDYQVTVTSAAEGIAGDGIHKATSAHYPGWAIDIRIRDFPDCKFKYKVVNGKRVWYVIKGGDKLSAWGKKIQSKLGSRYTVLLEVEKLHIHIQFNG